MRLKIEKHPKEAHGQENNYSALCLSILMLAPFSPKTFGARGPKNFHAGAVYVLTNQTTNTVAVFRTTREECLPQQENFQPGALVILRHNRPIQRPIHSLRKAR
jgi:hypothetical protein